LVTVLALIFGLDQSKAKFHALQFPFGVPEDHRLAVGDNGTHRWTPTQVAVPAIGTHKDLGYYNKTYLSGEGQFKVTLQHLTTALEVIKQKF
jgi:hypothetical protein